MYDYHEICAIIVSYNCDELIKKNVQSLNTQVNEIIIIDNNSDLESKTILDELKIEFNIKIIYNVENFGIAKALNQGIKYANSKKYRLLLTMDQDSVLEKDAVKLMISILNVNEEIVSVGVNYLGKKFHSKYKLVKYLITSGNLVKVRNIIEVGGYNEALFIDGVDFDISLQLRKNGYKIAICSEANMRHHIGVVKEKEIFTKSFSFSSHSALRYYYIFRNHNYLINEYFHTDPIFCLKKQITLIKFFFESILLEENKKEILKMLIIASKDSIKGKMGSFND